MGKTKTPQERYRERREREAAEQSTRLPPGLINHGNTCFMNSVLQGLNALPYLQQIVLMQLPDSRRSPALTNGRGGEFEQEWTEGLRLSDTFIILMNKAWRIKEEKLRTSMSPKELLSVLGQKYSQYNDFRQQDAHEFLRLLLDGMRMEEFDIIKKRQPPIPKSKKGKRKAGSERTNGNRPIPPEDQLLSFVDATFTGHLASILVCQSCKYVSITREPFDDLSLSIKPEDVKRHRLRAFAHKLMNKEKIDSAPLPRAVSAPSSRPSTPMGGFGGFGALTASPRRRSLEKETEDSSSNDNHPIEGATLRDNSDRHDSGESFGTKLGRRVSLNWKQVKREARKVSKPHEHITASAEDDGGQVLDITSSPANIPSSSPGSIASVGSLPPTPHSPAFADKKAGKRKARAQAAYVKSLLADHPSGKPLNPFAYLPSGSSWAKLAPEQGLEQCLRQFTSVELLENENMYGCRRCWKIANGLAVPNEDPDREDDEEDEEDEGEQHSHPSSVEAPPPSSRLSPATTSGIESNRDADISALNLASSISSLPERSTRFSGRPIPSRTMSIPVITTEPPGSPSPEPSDVGHSLEAGNGSPPFVITETAASSTSFLSADLRMISHRRQGAMVDDDSLSGLSSDESSDEGMSDTSITSTSSQSSATQSKAAAAREKRAQRAKEVIMRKAYKRYLIAKPPPVLVVHLKRFQQVSKTSSMLFGNLKKLDEYVPFPEYLDLSGYLVPRKRDFGLGSGSHGLFGDDETTVGDGLNQQQSTSCIYRLVSVVVHIGNMLGGHYIAYTALASDENGGPQQEKEDPSEQLNHPHGSHNHPTRQSATSAHQLSRSKHSSHLPSTTATQSPTANPPPRRWCYISDTVVRIVPFDEVLKSKAYMCMYERIEGVPGPSDPDGNTGAKL